MAIYYVYSGAGGSNNGSSWANAFTTLTTAFATEAAGDTLYVAHDHVEATGSAVVLTSSGTVANLTKVICVNRAGSVPPVSADRRTTAQVTTTGNFSLSVNGFTHYDGIIFIAGNTTGTANLNIGNSAFTQRFDNCSLRVGSTGAASGIVMSSTSAFVDLNNTTVSFGNVGQSINNAASLRWCNTPSALLNTIPTILFTPTGVGNNECIGVDFSAAGSGKTIYGATAGTSAKFRLIDCKLNASVTKSVVPTSGGPNAAELIRTGSAGVNYTVHMHRIAGLLTEETTIVRTGGATDGTTPLAWKIITTANCTFSTPYDCPPIAIWNDTTGSARTATIECIGAAIATDQEVWVEVQYLSDASSPIATLVNDGKADLLATAANQTSSAASWGGSTAPFKLGVTFTPQQKGWVYARVKIGKASSTFYVDPLVTLT